MFPSLPPSLLESIVTNIDLMTDQDREWWANNWFNVLRLLL